nr:MAG TPA: hypothetical protein [Microviridae sp.]
MIHDLKFKRTIESVRATQALVAFFLHQFKHP